MFYFGVQRWENTSRGLKPRMVWGNGYASAQEAIEANEEYIAKHLGDKFTVAQFDKDPREVGKQPA